MKKHWVKLAMAFCGLVIIVLATINGTPAWMAMPITFFYRH